MLKGHVQIDLHNHKSGFKERIEGDNMITDAVKYLISNLAGANCLNYAMPIYERLLGSLMIFDGKLEENRSNIFFPGENAHLVALAGRNTNTSSSIAGSLNAIESHETDNGYVNVWDFGTSQANGTIQSLALTYAHSAGGELVFVGRVDDDIHKARKHNGNIPGSNDFTARAFWYDKEKQLLYLQEGTVVYRQYVPTRLYGIKDNLNEARDIEDVITVPSDLSFYNAYDGYAYAFKNFKNDSSGNASFSYYTLKLSDNGFELSEEKQVTLKNCKILTSGNSAILPSKGHAFVVSNDRKSFYIVNLSNPESIVQANVPESYAREYTSYMYALKNGGIVVNYGSSPNYNALIIYLDGKTVSSERNISINNMVLTDTLGVYRYAYGGICTNYLGSIFNLTQPITKTAETSMKITYTLTDVE